MIYAQLASRLGYGDILRVSILLLGLSFAWYKPRWGDRFFTTIERAGARLAEKRYLAISLLAIAVIVLRLSLLWLIPIPAPHVHDEFSYLLAADTFAHGRLTNPPHPMWIFFDTIHVNQHPTYMSKYSPAQGAMLALGQLFGHPWVGVLLSAAAMCGAILWALQGWLPPSWALVGAVLVFFRVGIFSYWMNSYWGGAVAAIGGALVVGAMPRIFRFQRPRDALLMGAGATLLANSRPLEGLVLCLPLMAALFWWLCSRQSPSWRVTLPRVIAPFGAILLLCGIFIAYYNWRGTGHPILFPYTVNEQTYLSTPTLFWENARAPLHYMNPQFDAFYNGWSRQLWLENRVNSLRQTANHLLWIVLSTVYFYLWPELCILFFALHRVLLERGSRFLIAQTFICYAGFLLVPWFQPHYAAPLVATLFVIVAQALQYLRRWEFHERPVGIGLSRAIVLFAIFLAPFHPHAANLGHTALAGIEYRAQFTAQLNSAPGQQLIIVRYAADHNPLQEWVYNRADIDHAKVVWAREIPGVDIHPLLEYFRGRQVWLVEPDAMPPRMTPYLETAAQ